MNGKRLLLAGLGICLFMTWSAAAQQAKKQPRQTTPAKAVDVEYITGPRVQPRPFSDIVRVGNMLYLSGQLGVDEQGVVVQGGIKAETKQALERIRRLLEQNNSSMRNVVKCTCMLVDMSEWAAMNEVYITYFEKDRLPARSAFGTNGLARNARVEIECLATVKTP